MYMSVQVLLNDSLVQVDILIYHQSSTIKITNKHHYIYRKRLQG